MTVYRSVSNGSFPIPDGRELVLVPEQKVDRTTFSQDEIDYLARRGFIVADNVEDDTPARRRK